MRYRAIALIAALAAVFVLPATGRTAPPTDPVRGSACGDIVFSDSDSSGPPAYRGTEGQSATVDALLTTAKPSCSGMVYTMYIYTDTTQATQIDSRVFNGDGVTSAFSWLYTFQTGAPHSVCVGATSTREGRIVDAAPSSFTPGSSGSGCYSLVINSSGGGSGLN